MSFAENKLEISIAGLVIVLAGGVFHLFSGMKSRPQVESDIVYEMPRPKNFQGSDFDLSNREISRNYVNPFVKKEAKTMAKGNEKPADPKVQAAEKAKKKAAAVAAATAKKKSAVTSRVVDGTTKSGFGSDSGAGGSQYGNTVNRGVATPQNVAGAGAATDSDPAAKEDEGGLSPDQWRALLLAQPTKANMLKLIGARNKAQVDGATYNAIIADLLKTSNAETQDVGLYGAKTFPTSESFVIVAQAESTLTAENKTNAEAFLQTYGKGSRVPALMAVLQMNDANVVNKAAQIFMTGYQQAKNGTTPISDPRNGRGEVTSNSLANYLKFIPVFQALSQSSDSSLASVANSVLAQMQMA